MIRPYLMGGMEPETLTWFAAHPTATPAEVAALDVQNKTIRSGGTVTLASVAAYLSLVNGTAFVSPATVDLTPWSSTYWGSTALRLTFTGSGSTTGYFTAGAAGTGETLDTEIIANASFTGTWASNVPQSWNLNGTQDANKYLVGDDAGDRITIVSDGSAMGLYQAGRCSAAGAGSLVRASITIDTIVSGKVKFLGGSGYTVIGVNGTSGIGTTGTYTGYGTVPSSGGDANIYLIQGSACNITVSDTSLKKVLTPTALGLSATGNWTQGGTPLTGNGGPYTIEIKKE